MPAITRALALIAWVLCSFPARADAPEAQVLDLSETQRLALERQPLLGAQDARVRAASERAVAAGRLPDPELLAGFDNLSVTTLDPYAADAERMTMTRFGLMQEFPNAARRDAQRRQQHLLSDVAQAEREALARDVTREAALAWIDLWQSSQAAALVEALAGEARRMRNATGIDYRSARSEQGAVHEAAIRLALLEDRRQQLQQDEAAARARLARWIADDAQRPVAIALPTPGPLPPLANVLAALDRHPELRSGERSADASAAAIDLARAAYRPDWRVQASYGYRRPYDDMVSVEVGIDLPWFTANRQDRELAAAQAEHEAASASLDDRRRELRAALETAWRNSAALEQRLVRYDAELLPAAAARSDVALAAYRSARGTLADLLDARSGALDLQLMQLELRAELQRQRAQLAWLFPEN
ncbi:MAG: TolC family protein [Sinimarinibacterium sp.]|jgi:outer membrane protein TolC